MKFLSTVAGTPWLCGLVVVILTVVVCAPALGTAFFTLDDYRYLQELRDLDDGAPGALARSLLVENRWDQLWWIPEGSFVRFFRPLVIPTYALDRSLWGLEPVAFVATNIVLHVIATLLVMAAFARLLGQGLGALVAGVSFGTQASHIESIFFVAGRTTTLAGIAFAAALWLHLRTRERQTTRTQTLVALACFAAFLGKESTVLLPIFLVLLDLCVPPGDARLGPIQAVRRNKTLLLGCFALGLAYLAVRQLALGDGGSGSSPYPYLHLPDRDDFVPRTLAVWVQYCLGLSVGTTILPFTSVPALLWERTSQLEIVAGLLWLHSLCLWALVDRRGRFLAVLLLVSIVPLLPLYSASRHVYLASIGYCGLLGLLVQRVTASSRTSRTALLFTVGIVAVFVVLPAARLAIALDEHPRRLSTPHPAKTYAALFADSELKLRPERPLYLLDFPGRWYEMQLVRSALEVELDASLPPIRFLTPALRNPHHAGRAIRLHRVDDTTVVLERDGAPLFDPDSRQRETPPTDALPALDNRRFEPGDVARRPGYEVEVLASEGDLPTRVEVRFDRLLAEIDLGHFVRTGDRWTLRRVRP